MGLITGALQIGKSALLSYQSALQVVGNNIANVSTDGYTRQSPILTPVGSLTLPEGFLPGGGVALTGLRRNVDETLENRYRLSTGDQASVEVQQQVIGRIESVMNELTDSDLSTLLQNLFNSFDALQNAPHDIASRGMVLTAAGSVASEISRQRAEVLALRGELNSNLESSALRANELAGDIADLNVRIAELESTGNGGANSLRDQRDMHLRELAELVQIEVREQPNGAVNVYVGNEPLIQAGLNRGLTTTLETAGGNPRVVVRFADNNTEITMRGGRMAGLVTSRDTHLMGQIEALDNLSRALIWEVNQVHANGQGLVGYTNVLGTYDVQDANAALNSGAANMAYRPQNGSFLINVKDKDSGLITQSLITVNLDGVGADDSLNSLVEQINGKIGNAQAVATGDNRLQFIADDGFEISFAEDSSNVLAGLGVNTFFTGYDSQSMSVNQTLIANPNLLAAATQNTPGDGSNAGRISALGDMPISGLGNRSLSDFYNAIVSDVATKGASARSLVNATEAINLALASQRESISGVSLDEETIALMKLERSFQGAARYVSTVDQMIQEMLTLIG